MASIKMHIHQRLRGVAFRTTSPKSMHLIPPEAISLRQNWLLGRKEEANILPSFREGKHGEEGTRRGLSWAGLGTAWRQSRSIQQNTVKAVRC